MRIFVLDRVHERHPELSEQDVVTALRSVMVEAQRADGTWMAIGLDGRGRDLELLYNERDGVLVVYHAFTPPTRKFVREIKELGGEPCA